MSREEDDIEQMEYIRRWETNTRRKQAEILAIRRSIAGKSIIERARGVIRILQVRYKYWRKWNRE